MAGYGKPKSGKRNYLVIGLVVFVVALVVYFLFFTGQADKSTRTNVPLKPSAQSEAPEPAPNASPAPDEIPTSQQAK